MHVLSAEHNIPLPVHSVLWPGTECSFNSNSMYMYRQNVFCPIHFCKIYTL